MKVIPPIMATWMLKHLVLGDRNEALEGDLLEEFHRRRSATWYWRQVLGAMLLSYSNVLRTGWVVIWTIVFAVSWVYGLYEITRLIAHSPVQVPFGNWIRREPYHGWPILFPEVMVAFIAAALAVYLVLTRNLTLRAFTVGFGVGAAGQVIMLVLLLHRFAFFDPLSRALNPPLDYLFAHARAEHWDVRFWVHIYGVLQLSLPLLAAICATKVRRSILRRLPGAVATSIRNVMLGSPKQAPCDRS
jgi:hypothetical protein